MLCLATVQAVEVSVEPNTVRIPIDGTAFFNVMLVNEGAVTAVYAISSPSVMTAQWDIHTEPRSDRYVTLTPGSSKTVSLAIKPASPELTYNKHLITVIVDKQEGGSSVREYSSDINVDLYNPNKEAVFYAPNVALEPKPEIPPYVTAGQRYTMKVYLQNKNSLAIQEAVLYVASPFFSEERTVAVEGFEQKEVEFNFDIPAYEKPRQGKLTVEFLVEGKVISGYTLDVALPEVDQGITEIVQIERSWSSATEFIQFNNPSNVVRVKEYHYPYSLFNRVFAKFEPAGGIQGDYYVWRIELQPGGSTTIAVTKEYYSLYVALLIVLCLCFVLHYFNPQASVRKEVRQTKNGIEVVIHLKNKDDLPLSHIFVRDVVPAVFQYVPTMHQVGAIRPHQVNGGRDGATVVMWELPSLGGKEELLLQYSLGMRVAIDGRVKFPGCCVHYQVKNKKEYSYSPKVSKTFKYEK